MISPSSLFNDTGGAMWLFRHTSMQVGPFYLCTSNHNHSSHPFIHIAKRLLQIQSYLHCVLFSISFANARFEHATAKVNSRWVICYQLLYKLNTFCCNLRNKLAKYISIHTFCSWTLTLLITYKIQFVYHSYLMPSHVKTRTNNKVMYCSYKLVSEDPRIIRILFLFRKCYVKVSEAW